MALLRALLNNHRACLCEALRGNRVQVWEACGQPGPAEEDHRLMTAEPDGVSWGCTVDHPSPLWMRPIVTVYIVLRLGWGVIFASSYRMEARLSWAGCERNYVHYLERLQHVSQHQPLLWAVQGLEQSSGLKPPRWGSLGTLGMGGGARTQHHFLFSLFLYKRSISCLIHLKILHFSVCVFGKNRSLWGLQAPAKFYEQLFKA